MKYFRCIDRGVPVPLKRKIADMAFKSVYEDKLNTIKIPVGSCLKDFRKYFVAIVIIFMVTAIMTCANWKVFKAGHVPVELTADEVKTKTQECYSKGKKALFSYDEQFKVYFIKCR